MSDRTRKLTPRKIVQELDKYIIGQAQAKRTVASALRWRWRRMRVEASLRDEISPKNILMIGPTGVGKTEISRRLARLVGAPFIKVEATKFTEVGYVGRDVESIIRDLLDVAVEDVREELAERVRERAEAHAEERVLNALLPSSSVSDETREKMRRQLRAGDLDDREVEIEMSATAQQVEVLSPPGLEEVTAQFQGLLKNFTKDRRRKRMMRVIDAFEQCAEEETQDLIDMNEARDIAIERVENNGIVFIDEIDKIAEMGAAGGADVSRHGVQRDLLPLVEGTTVSTRHGSVHTDHILFVAAGAFHYSRPSDLIPELQGRFPLRVRLSPLTVDDFKRILTGTRACLTRQYQALMKTERVALEFTDDGVVEIADTAWRVNESSENIGARRLYAVMEKVLEEVSYNADELRGQKVVVDKVAVRRALDNLSENTEQMSYVL